MPAANEQVDARREELRRIHEQVMADHSLSSTDAVRYIATKTGRTEWTVWHWISRKEGTFTIPTDTLELLRLKLEADAARSSA